MDNATSEDVTPRGMQVVVHETLINADEVVLVEALGVGGLLSADVVVWEVVPADPTLEGFSLADVAVGRMPPVIGQFQTNVPVVGCTVSVTVGSAENMAVWGPEVVGGVVSV